MRDRPHDRYTREGIGERDGWICGLCDDPIDRARLYPDPRAPSVDHIRHLSNDGTDTLDNVRITHWGCNHERNSFEEMTTLEDAQRAKQFLIEFFKQEDIPAGLEYANSLEPAQMLQQSRERHAPEAYRARLARRVERYEREGK